MEYKDIIAVSGLPDLYELKSSRSNGLMVSHIDTKKTKFCSVRKHQFTPLETVAIYTITDTTPLKDVFKKMRELEKTTELISTKASSDELMSFFGQVLPDFDSDRVYPSDVKKIIKWYNFLKERDLLSTIDAVASEEEE